MSAADLLIWLTILVLVAMLASGTAQEVVTGLPRAGRYISRLWPPRLAALPDLGPAILETAQIAVFGTMLGFITSLPIALLACHKMTSFLPLYLGARVILLLMRGLPAMILAIIFICAVGLGPLAGIMGVWIYSGGVLGKLISENFEAADQDVLDAAAIDGCNKWQGYLYVLLPMQANAVLSFLLYRFESSFRAATLAGVAGCGGLGLELTAAMGLFDYGKISLIICVILACVLSLDLGSRLLRRRFL